MSCAGGGLAVPQEIPIIRSFACERYYQTHSTGMLEHEDRCQIPEIAKIAGEIITGARMFNALMTMLCLTMYSDLLSRVGRKPMFAFTAFCLTASILCFGLGAYLRGPLGMVLIALNFFFSGIGSQPLLQLTFQSYIVDCVDAEERSPTFALLGSATFSGLAIAALASAGMTAHTNMPLLPFWVGTGVFFTMFTYAVFILPEALTADRREELMGANEATQEGDHDDHFGEEAPKNSSWHTFITRINFFRKLAILLPKKTTAGNYDYRLFVLSLSFLIYRVGGLYTNDLLLLTTTGSFGFTGAENGVLVGFVTASKALLLMGVLPFIIRFGRNKYVELVQQKSNVTPGGLSEGSRLLSSSSRGNSYEGEAQSKPEEEEKSDGSERFDMYFGALSFLIDALALTSVGLSREVWQLYASTALLSIAAAGGPSVQAMFTQVSAKAMTDQVLSGVGILENIGAVLSPLVLGSIYTSTSASAPSTAWFVAASLYVIASATMLGTPSRASIVPHKQKSSRKNSPSRNTA